MVGQELDDRDVSCHLHMTADRELIRLAPFRNENFCFEFKLNHILA